MKETHYKISFNYFAGTIRVAYEILKAMDLPKYIKFLLNVKDKEILILETDKKDIDRIEINYNIKSIERNTRFYSKLLVEKIFATSGWNLSKTYSAILKYNENTNAYGANLNEAVILERNRHGLAVNH